MTIGRPKSVFKANNKPINVTVTTPLPVQSGSKEALTKASNYFIPGPAFANPPVTRRSGLREAGYPGLNISGGYVNEEFISALSGRRGVQVYEEMRKNDPIVGAMLLIAEQLIHNATVFVKPNDHNPDAQESLMAANLVRTSLYDMGNIWTDILSEILTFLAFGWSYTSVWHRKREGYNRNPNKSSRYTDGKYGWASISLRGQSTLQRWDTDEKGRALGMVQQGPPTYESVFIPNTHAGHFRTRTEKSNPEGISILRNAWRPYWIKKQLEETEAIGIGKDLTGTLVLTVPEGLDLWNSGDSNAAAALTRCQDIVSLSKLDTLGGHVLPFGYDLSVITTPGQRAHNSHTVIQRWDQRIAVTLLADMLLIGHERVGSFALVKSKSRLFSASLESYAARVSGVFNRDLIPRLMLLNGIPQEYWPTMGFGPVDTPDLKEFADYLKAMFDVGINIDESIGLAARQHGHLPAPNDGDSAVKTFEDGLDEQKQRQEMLQEFAPKDTGEDKGNFGNDKGNNDKDKDKDKTKKSVLIVDDPISRYSAGVD